MHNMICNTFYSKESLHSKCLPSLSNSKEIKYMKLKLIKLNEWKLKLILYLHFF